MTRASRILAIASVLTKSQLRAGRSGRGGQSLFRNPAILVLIDAICFVAAGLAGFGVMSAVSFLPPTQAALVVTAISQMLVFIPALIPSIVLVAGVLFELSVSSKFASSDAINWLPVTQTEYVTASTLSITFTYSLVPSLVLGFALWPSIVLGFMAAWVETLFLSVVSLFYGGAIIEIIRAAINRVGTAVMKRARRGALVLRLAVMVVVVVIFQVIFNFYFLIELINLFASTLSVVAFLPVLWASLAVRATLGGDALQSVGFSAGTLGFASAMLLIAVKVRARYWSPTPSEVAVTTREYRPGESRGPLLGALGLGPLEVALVKKDLKGLARRRELLSYFSIPFVLGVVFLLQISFNPAMSSGSARGSQIPGVVEQLPVWFVGGLFGLIFSSIGFGQEQKSAPLLYSFPLTAKQVLRAKLFVSLLLAMVATVAIFVVITALTRPNPTVAAQNFVVAVAITAQEVCLGTAFGARYPDFAERPRPRFVDPIGILVMVLVGMVVMGVTALPTILADALTSFPSLQAQLRPLMLVSIAFAVAIVGLSYSWASRETKKLFVEFKW